MLVHSEDPYLSNNYAPVDEETATAELSVIGEIPRDLNGCFIRTGSNPKFAPKGRYHWFDGDGMVHATHIEGGSARYANRYVRTEGLAIDEAAGAAQWSGIMERPDFRNPRGPYKDTSNTDLVFHAGQLLSLWWLSGKAYALSLPDCETIGVQNWNGKLPRAISAHPKVDPRTGEMMFFDFSPLPPYLAYGVISAEGEISHHAEIELPAYRLQHDTAITPNYSVLFDMAMMYDPQYLAQGKTKLIFERNQPSRIGIIPRFGTNAEVRWFEVAPFFLYHTINAWEENNEVVLIGCRIEEPLVGDPANTADSRTVPSIGMLRLAPVLYEWRLDLSSGMVKERVLDDTHTEFPRMNNQFLGKPSRYSYNPRIASLETIAFDAVIQYDLVNGKQQTYEYPKNWYAGETTFAPANGATHEDDGYVLTYAAKVDGAESELWVLAASDIAQGPVARIQIPQRMPYGYHTWWVSAAEMAQQVGLD